MNKKIVILTGAGISADSIDNTAFFTSFQIL